MNHAPDSTELRNELTTRFDAIKANEQWDLIKDLDAYRESKAFKFKREFFFDVTEFYLIGSIELEAQVKLGTLVK